MREAPCSSLCGLTIDALRFLDYCEKTTHTYLATHVQWPGVELSCTR